LALPRKVGLDGAAGLPEPPERVAIAVGNTYDGASLPANPSFVRPVPLLIVVSNWIALMVWGL
jgi:hypothetical protein